MTLRDNIDIQLRNLKSRLELTDEGKANLHKVYSLSRKPHIKVGLINNQPEYRICAKCQKKLPLICFDDNSKICNYCKKFI